MIYLDNILIFLENPTKYIETVQEVFERLRENKLFANLKKYDFNTNTIKFLGFIIRPNRTKIDPSYVYEHRDKSPCLQGIFLTKKKHSKIKVIFFISKF
jgi:hypothetical protein